MGNHILKIITINNLTHDVLRITTNKPVGLEFKPGQAANYLLTKAGG